MGLELELLLIFCQVSFFFKSFVKLKKNQAHQLAKIAH